jgi:hypothetical protein
MFLERNEKARELNRTSKNHIDINEKIGQNRNTKQNSYRSDLVDHTVGNDRSFQLELEHTATFGKKAQALIGGYDFKALKNVTEHKAFHNIKDFQDSKPSVNKDSIKIYSYRTNLKGDLSKYECVWYKFKSPEVIDSVLEIPKIGNPVDPKKVLELTFDEAKKIVPFSAAIVNAKGYKFTFDSQDMRTGFNWISSDITLELKQDKKIYIKTPTLITNRYVPIFGGMTYCKVFTPKDAAKIILDLANGDLRL